MSTARTWGVRLILAATGSLLLATPSVSQSTVPLRFVVPFPAGGPVDSMARTVGEAVAKQTGRTVIVENKPGADGALGALAVINAPPDGNTLLFATNTALLAPPTLRVNPPYDPTVALTPISFVGNTEFFLYVHASVPAGTVHDLVDFAKRNPNRLSYAAQNSSSLIATAQLIKATSIEMIKIPYRGDSPAIGDLLSGRIQVMFSSSTSLLEQVKAETVQAPAVLASRRSILAPHVPTFSEAGFENLALTAWVAIFGPPKLPQPILTRLSEDIMAALASESAAERLRRLGTLAEPSTPAQLGSFLKSQLDLWKTLIDEAGIERN